MPKPIHVTCLGAGYVAVSLSRALRKKVKSGEIILSIIDRDNFHTFHGLVPEMIAGKIQPNTITSPARKLFPYSKFYCGEIEDVNYEKKTVAVSRRLDGKEFIVPFDHLVLGLGTTDNLSHYPGVSENAYRLRRFYDAFQLRNHIPLMLELAEIEEDKEERKRLLTFVVAGGNYAGVEVACELAAYRDALKKQGNLKTLIDEIRIVLLHAGDKILPELSSRFPKLGKYAEKAIKKHDIELQYNTRIVSATPNVAITDKDEQILTRTIISCTGMSPNPLIQEWNFETDRFGRVITNKHLQVLGQEKVWAGGDCAAVPHPLMDYCPPLAIYAMNAGKKIGKNILHMMSGKPLIENKFNSFGDACSLANHTAVGQLEGIQMHGFLTWVLWRIFMFIYLPSMNRRLRLFNDYLIGIFTGRDLINLQRDNSLGIEEKYFEKGETVIKEGDYGNAMYILLKGELEVIKGVGGNSPELLATLTSGSHFGEISVFTKKQRSASVVAKTPVNVLELKRSAAQVLSQSFNQLKETPGSSK